MRFKLHDLLKDLQRYVDLMKLLTALLDVLQSRYHKISSEDTIKNTMLS